MHIGKRVFLYLTRKKGKNLILCGIFFLISFSVLAGISVFAGASQISKDLRSNIGASFDIRPYEQFVTENGQVSSNGTPVIYESAIRQILDVIGTELKTYNTEHHGFAKGQNLSFIAGMGHSEDSNMGEVIAVRDSSLTKTFFNEECRLIEGSHIKPEDKNKVLISKELARENQLSVGDTLRLTHAELGNGNGDYVDLIKEKTAFATVEIKGIFEIKNMADSGLNPTAKKAENMIFSDRQLLFDLREQKQDVYEGEISFFISDPLLLNDITEKVKNLTLIDWNNHIVQKNDFKFSKISAQLQTIQNIVTSLIVIVSILGIVILMLIMTLRIRGRIKEAGILLSIGRSKKEIVGQFVIEAVFVLLMGFLLAVIIFIPVSSMLNTHLFATVMQETIKDIQLTTRNTNYLQLDFYKTILLLGTETGMTALTVIVSSAMVLSLKPKEILTKMS